MTSNFIKGIDEVIKGLTTIKGAIQAQEATSTLIEAVKDAVGEALGEATVDINVVAEDDVKVEKVLKEVKAVKPTVKEVPEEDIEEEDEEENDFDVEARHKELTKMKYNELKVLAGTIKGASAVGKKADVIASILDAEANGAVSTEEETEEEEEEVIVKKKITQKEEVEEVEEEEDDSEEEAEEVEYSEQDYEEFTEFLTEMKIEEIKDIAIEAGFELGKRVIKTSLIKKLVADLDVLIQTLDDLGYYDEDEEEIVEEAVEEVEEVEEEEEGMENLADEYGLNEMTVEELADICTDYDLSTKGKKQALIDRIVKGMLDGTIDFESEDDEEEEVEEVVEEKPKKAKKKAVKEVEEEPEEEIEDIEKTPKMTKAEDKIEADIRKKYKAKKLKDATIKKFLDKYFEGSPKVMAKKLSNSVLLEMYIEIHTGLVDDEGAVSAFEEPYIRGQEYHCCGKVLKELDEDTMYCTACAVEYES